MKGYRTYINPSTKDVNQQVPSEQRKRFIRQTNIQHAYKLISLICLPVTVPLTEWCIAFCKFASVVIFGPIECALLLFRNHHPHTQHTIISHTLNWIAIICIQIYMSPNTSHYPKLKCSMGGRRKKLTELAQCSIHNISGQVFCELWVALQNWNQFDK